MDVAVIAAFYGQLLDTGVRRPADHRRQLRPVRDPVGNRDRRVEGDGVAGDRRDLVHLVGRMVRVDLEVAEDRAVIAQAAVVAVHAGVVDVPDHAIVR